MADAKLPVLKPDWDNAVNSGQTFWVRKEQNMGVRYAYPGETTASGETAQENFVSILDNQGRALYCMPADEFLASSEPVNPNAELSEEITRWYVESTPRRALLVAEDTGPFHLDAPAAWNDHNGWDVTTVSEISSLDGDTQRGYLIVETDEGIMHDQNAVKDGLYKACPAPRP